jgi:hypothetical protein
MHEKRNLSYYLDFFKDFLKENDGWYKDNDDLIQDFLSNLFVYYWEQEEFLSIEDVNYIYRNEIIEEYNPKTLENINLYACLAIVEEALYIFLEKEGAQQ